MSESNKQAYDNIVKAIAGDPVPSMTERDALDNIALAIQKGDPVGVSIVCDMPTMEISDVSVEASLGGGGMYVTLTVPITNDLTVTEFNKKYDTKTLYGGAEIIDLGLNANPKDKSFLPCYVEGVEVSFSFPDDIVQAFELHVRFPKTHKDEVDAFLNRYEEGLMLPPNIGFPWKSGALFKQFKNGDEYVLVSARQIK